MNPAEYERQIDEVARPALERLKALCLAENILRPGRDLRVLPRGRATARRSPSTRTTTARRGMTFDFPRQDFGDFLCLADYVEPARRQGGRLRRVHGGDDGPRGHASVHTSWYDAGKYQDYLFLHGLGVESAEALAEYFHQRTAPRVGHRRRTTRRTIRKLFKGHYRGCRYAFGYPACPNLEDQAPLFTLIDPTRVGITLSEQFQLEPEQSTTAIVVHHPKAKYFNTSRSANCGRRNEAKISPQRHKVSTENHTEDRGRNPVLSLCVLFVLFVPLR